jgi:hypothetical protein
MSSIIIVNELLKRNTAVKAIVTNRIFPIQAPQSANGAYIVTNEVSSHDNALVATPGEYYRDRVSVECIAPGALEVINLGKAVMACLDGVLDRTITDYKDVTIRFANVGISDQNDIQTAFRILRQYHVWWRMRE